MQSFLKGSCGVVGRGRTTGGGGKDHVELGGRKGNVATRVRADIPPCLVPTPRQSALSRALLQPNAWAAATVARVAGPGLVKPVGTDLKGAESPGTLGWMSDCSLQLVGVGRGGGTWTF